MPSKKSGLYRYEISYTTSTILYEVSNFTNCTCLTVMCTCFILTDYIKIRNQSFHIRYGYTVITFSCHLFSTRWWRHKTTLDTTSRTYRWPSTTIYPRLIRWIQQCPWNTTRLRTRRRLHSAWTNHRSQGNWDLLRRGNSDFVLDCTRRRSWFWCRYVYP